MKRLLGSVGILELLRQAGSEERSIIDYLPAMAAESLGDRRRKFLGSAGEDRVDR